VDEKRETRIVFAGGGTGGHVFPALAVADELRRRRPHAHIEFLGGSRGLETRVVPKHGYPLRTLPLFGLKGASMIESTRAAASAAAGTARCTGWFLASRPGLVIGVGGYASGPAVLAAKLVGVRTLILEQNHFPGATNRFLARFANEVCVPSEAARERLAGRGIVTGNPVAPEFGSIPPVVATEPATILIFGGSRGARSLNRAAVAALPLLAQRSHLPRIVHQTGPESLTETEKSYRAAYPGQFDVAAFFDDMPRRVAEAQLVVCRAGATTLAELALAGRPALLVPYPFAADDHQTKNAEAVERVGGALVLKDAELSGERLAATIAALLDDPDRLRRMGEAARTLARPDAAGKIADVAERLLEGGRRVS